MKIFIASAEKVPTIKFAERCFLGVI